MNKEITRTKFRPNRDVDKCGRTNNDRANRAAVALITHREGEPVDEADLRDLLANLMHMCDRDGTWDFEAELRSAARNYRDER